MMGDRRTIHGSALVNFPVSVVHFDVMCRNSLGPLFSSVLLFKCLGLNFKDHEIIW